jgi:hypothetical protein
LFLKNVGDNHLNNALEKLFSYVVYMYIDGSGNNHCKIY